MLSDFARAHSEVRAAIEAWVSEVTAADWSKPDDIRARYATASFMAGNRVVFNLKGNKYRLDAKIAYQTRVVLVKRIGTHAEYNDWVF